MKIVFLDMCGDKTAIRSEVKMASIDENLYSIDNGDGSLLLVQYNKHRDIELLEHEYDYRIGDNQLVKINEASKSEFEKLQKINYLREESKEEVDYIFQCLVNNGNSEELCKKYANNTHISNYTDDEMQIIIDYKKNYCENNI